MQVHRRAYANLLRWKTSPARKPLILRGARQVGKTTLVKEFSKEFTHYIGLNLERKADRAFFDEFDGTDALVNAILLSRNIPNGSSDVLLFIDEIQESPAAIAQLRYLYETRSELHVIAAGSLLEFALSEVESFPVGRVEFMVLHPIDFMEFVEAKGHDTALAQMQEMPANDFAHATLLSLFHEYALVGGMPEVVTHHLENRDLVTLQKVYDGLWQAYKDDVEKYARNPTDRKVIRHVMNAAAQEKDRVSFEKFGKSNYGSREVGEALRSLDSAQVIRLIYPTTDMALPIGTDLRKRPHLQFLDTGLLVHALGIHGQLLGIRDLHDAARGRIVQHIVTQELMAQHDSPLCRPHFWVREKSDAQAEVDLVHVARGLVIPIEVKSGPQGKLRSLHSFIDRCDHGFAIRLHAGKLRREQWKTPAGKPFTLLNLPYYLAGRIPQYAEWLVGQG